MSRREAPPAARDLVDDGGDRSVRRRSRGSVFFRVLPGRPSFAALPIRDPILRPDLAVEAVVHGPDGKAAPIWLLLDSGATIGSLPTAVAADLRLVEERPATMIAVNGAARTSLVVAPRLDLGELGISRVAFRLDTLAGPAHELGVVGQSILARMPWEISWDRGRVTLGATPWADGGEVTSVPLEPFAGGVEMVTARINGDVQRARRSRSNDH